MTRAGAEGHGPEPTDAQLASIARASAARFGERRPTDMQRVASTLAEAVPIVSGGNSIAGGQGQVVDVVCMTGHFVVARGPRRLATRPTGAYLTVTVDRRTGGVVGVTVGSTRPPLEELGQVKSLEYAT